MRSRPVVFLALFALTSLIALGPMSAMSTVSGTGVEKNGAVVQKTTVTLNNPATNTTRSAPASGEGRRVQWETKQSHPGKSQTPVAKVAGVEETNPLKPT